MNRVYVPVLILLVLVFAKNEVRAQEKLEGLEVPLKYISFFLVNDEKCPLQLSNPRVLAETTGDLHYYFTIANNRNASVKSFEIEEFDAFENPSYGASAKGTAEDKFALGPYQSFPTLNEDNVIITHLDKDRATSFKLSEDRKKIWIAVVTKVTSYDGTVYDGTSKLAAIKKFLDSIQQEEDAAEEYDTPKLPFSEKEKRLRDFLGELMQDKR